jgi:hypothetical protein
VHAFISSPLQNYCLRISNSLVYKICHDTTENTVRFFLNDKPIKGWQATLRKEGLVLKIPAILINVMQYPLENNHSIHYGQSLILFLKMGDNYVMSQVEFRYFFWTNNSKLASNRCQIK